MTDVAAINHDKNNCVKLFSDNIYSRMDVDRFDMPQNNLPVLSGTYSKVRQLPGLIREIEKDYSAVLIPTYLLMSGINPDNYDLEVIPVVHDLEIIKSNQNPLQNYILNKTMDNLRKCEKIIAVSELTKIDLISTGINEETITVVNQGIDKERIYPESEPESLVDSNTILYIGSMIDRKNPEFLVDVLSHLDEKYQLLIGGKSYNEVNKRKFKEYAKEKGVTERINFTGYLSDQELRTAYTNAGIYLHPAYFEGYGRTPIEAAACGTTPVIYENVPSAQVIPQSVTFSKFDSYKVAQLIKKNIDVEIDYNATSWKETSKKIADIIGKK